MNKKLKLISLALVLTLAMSLFSGLTVFATGTPTPAAAEPYVASYSIDSDTWTYKPGTEIVKREVTVKIIDERIKDLNDAGVTKANAVPHNGAFTAIPVTGTINGTEITFVFNDVGYNGGAAAFTFDLSYEKLKDGKNVPVSTLSQTIGQCQELPADPIVTPDPTAEPTPKPTPAPTAEPDVPKILVKDFTFGGTSVEAGKEFTLDITLFTTSGNTSLKDVMVGLNFGEAKNVSLASGSMNTYVGEMAAGTTKHITYKIITAATIEPGAIGINVQVTSKNGEASSSPISIPVVQPERFEITNMEAPESIMMGEEGYLSVTFVNKGKSAINNLSASIQGDNLANPGQSQFLGNVAAGTENSVDFNVMASAEGTITGKVLLSYEDAKGEIQTLEKEFSCTVQAMPDMGGDMGGMFPDGMDPTMNPDVEGKGGMPWWGWLLIVVGVGGVAAVVVVIVLKKKKAKKLAQLEDEDEDI